MKKTTGYSAATMNIFRILRVLIKEIKWSPRFAVWTAGAVALEAWGRLLGIYDLRIRKKNPYIWDMAKTTKDHEK